MSAKKITIDLSSSEALVLFEFLFRFRDNEKLNIVDQSEERVLWDLLSKLESQLIDPLKPNYLDLLEKARTKVRDEKF